MMYTQWIYIYIYILTNHWGSHEWASFFLMIYWQCTCTSIAHVQICRKIQWLVWWPFNQCQLRTDFRTQLDRFWNTDYHFLPGSDLHHAFFSRPSQIVRPVPQPPWTNCTIIRQPSLVHALTQQECPSLYSVIKSFKTKIGVIKWLNL